MITVTLTDEEFETVAIAIENCLTNARRLQAAPDADLDDLLDAGALIQRYQALEHKFPPPEIGLKETP